eukprot:scaffold78548_cov60-Phaeocystis_antarctica.AAC.1
MVSNTTRLVCYAIPRCPGPSHPDTKVRYTGDNDTPLKKPRDSARPGLLTAYLSISLSPVVPSFQTLSPDRGAPSAIGASASPQQQPCRRRSS